MRAAIYYFLFILGQEMLMRAGIYFICLFIFWSNWVMRQVIYLFSLPQEQCGMLFISKYSSKLTFLCLKTVKITISMREDYLF